MKVKKVIIKILRAKKNKSILCTTNVFVVPQQLGKQIYILDTK